MSHSLVTLPTEMRQLIWNEYLDLVQNADVDNHSRATKERRSHYLPWTNLQLTNQLIYNEILNTLVQRGRFMTVSLRSHHGLVLPQLRSQAMLALSMRTIHVAITIRSQLRAEEARAILVSMFHDLDNFFGVLLEPVGFTEVSFETRRGRVWEYSVWFDVL